METISKGLITKVTIVVATLLSTLVFAGLSISSATPSQTASGYSKEQCKNGGWKNMEDADGNKFKNQGDCVSYFSSGGRNPGNG